MVHDVRSSPGAPGAVSDADAPRIPAGTYIHSKGRDISRPYT